MKREITHTIIHEKVNIPDIVNEKCNAAYEAIRQEADFKPKKAHFKKKAVVISIAAAAAIACSATAAAAYFRSAYNFISKETYTKNPIEKMDLSAFAQPVNEENKQPNANITMQSVYCDGENISIAFMLTANNNELKNMSCITANVSSKLNGENVIAPYDYDRSSSSTEFFADDNGIFYGTVYFQKDDLGENIPDGSDFEITISSLRGYDYKHMTWQPDSADNYYEAGGYMPYAMDTFSDKFTFKTTLNADTSNNKLYEINETHDGITLKSAFITPFKTTISISGLDERQSFRVVDQNGEVLEAINSPDPETMELSTPLKTAKQLSVQIFDLDTDNFPTEYEFTFDIEKGFANKYNVKYDDSDVIYDPPREVFEEYWENEDKKKNSDLAEAAAKAEKIPVNTPVEIDDYIDESFVNDEPEIMTISWKITGSEVGDVIADDMDEDEWKWFEDFGITPENAKMLFVTYELTNVTDKTGSIYTNGGFNIYSDDFEAVTCEPDYVSYKDNGGKSSYKYNFEPYQTKTITYGYVISEDYANHEFYACGAGLYGGTASTEMTAANIEKGNVKLMEIK